MRVIDTAKPCLQNRATAFGLDDLLTIRVGALVDELQGDFLVWFRESSAR